MSYPDLSALQGFPGWQAARAASAVGPGPQPETTRRAYLDLLKLCLCDLAATTTVSVGKREDGTVTSRELRGEELRLRAAGMDWPMQGLTMVGLKRLDDLQACVEAVVEDGVEGDLIETGVWRGGASILMRATLDSLGDGRTVCVADSFQGFPEADAQGHLNQTGFLAVPQEEVAANFARFGLEGPVRFIPGFFEETLRGLAGSRWALIRLDGDTYEATWEALSALYPDLAPGGHVIIDDYRVVPECGRAVDAFRREHGIDEPLEDVDWTCVRWRRERAAATRSAPPPPAPAPARTQVRPRPPIDRPPDEHEVALRVEVAALRERLAQAENEAERLRASPIAGPRAWLRNRRNPGAAA